MSDLLTLIPVISKETTDLCIPSILADDSAAGLNSDDILIVDNSREGWAAERYGLRTHRDPDGHNLGVARAWNIGAREILDRGIDYVLLMSASMVFGPVLHTTWRGRMDAFWGEDIIEALGHSWHLIAIHRRLFELIGLFDENFYPAYFESIDWCYRLRMLDLEGGWPKEWCNAMSQGAALHNEVVSCPATPLLDYYAKKWGGKKGLERFTRPFGKRELDFWEECSIPELAERYRLTTWW